MALVTCGGADVLRGRISMATRGTWAAELVVESAKALTGTVTIAAAGGLTLKGTVVPDRTGVQLDACHLRVVGGAGGLAKDVSGAYQRPQLRDPLDAVMRASGESLSSMVAVNVLGVSLLRWTLGRCRAARALDDLAAAAGAALGSDIRWRVLEDGTVWMGAETWPAATLPEGDVVADAFPAERRYVLAVETPTVKPGVNLDGVGKIAAVEHWIMPHGVRSCVWT